VTPQLLSTIEAEHSKIRVEFKIRAGTSPSRRDFRFITTDQKQHKTWIKACVHQAGIANPDVITRRVDPSSLQTQAGVSVPSVAKPEQTVRQWELKATPKPPTEQTLSRELPDLRQSPVLISTITAVAHQIRFEAKIRTNGVDSDRRYTTTDNRVHKSWTKACVHQAILQDARLKTLLPSAHSPSRSPPRPANVVLPPGTSSKRPREQSANEARDLIRQEQDDLHQRQTKRLKERVDTLEGEAKQLQAAMLKSTAELAAADKQLTAAQAKVQEQTDWETEVADLHDSSTVLVGVIGANQSASAPKLAGLRTALCCTREKLRKREAELRQMNTPVGNRQQQVFRVRSLRDGHKTQVDQARARSQGAEARLAAHKDLLAEHNRSG
jgi:hypothetical protein